MATYLVFRVAEENPSQATEEVRSSDPELRLGERPRQLCERGGDAERIHRIGVLSLGALIGSPGEEVARVAFAPSLLATFAPSPLALGSTARALPLANSRVGLKAVPTNHAPALSP